MNTMSLIDKKLQEIMQDDYTQVDVFGDPIEHKSLEFPPAEYKDQESVVEVSDETKNADLVHDYHFVRNTLYGVIERGKQALEGSLELAKGSEMPRNYEVVATLINNITNTTDKLLGIHKKLDGELGLPTSQTNIQVNNHNYEYPVGSQDPKVISEMLSKLDSIKTEE